MVENVCASTKVLLGNHVMNQYKTRFTKVSTYKNIRHLGSVVIRPNVEKHQAIERIARILR